MRGDLKSQKEQGELYLLKYGMQVHVGGMI